MSRLLIAGYPDEVHVGSHFLAAARTLEIDAAISDVREAQKAPWLVKKVNWWLRGHRAGAMDSYGRGLIEHCRSFRPDLLLCTGTCPVDRETLLAVRELGIVTANYVTDDPWNPRFRAPWFLSALTCYDRVYTPRRANIEDLRNAGCAKVEYLPFAYAPEVHYPEPCENPECPPASDVVFAGGGDRDRIPYAKALIDAGLTLALYGGRWNRFMAARPYWRGHGSASTIRKALKSSKIALCLVRRANRDGNCMRTFEVPATGCCMLTEDTEDHRMLFGAEGESVLYFNTIPEMVKKAVWLTGNAPERARLSAEAHRRITSGGHTYADRLATILRAKADRAGATDNEMVRERNGAD
jgi:spore maturation protein CgeB